MDRTAAGAAVLLAALIVAASAAARDPKEPTLKPVAADVRLARTLVLGRADMPAGFKDAGVDTSGGNGSLGKACDAIVPDQHRLVMTADVTGHTFRHTAGGVGFSQIVTEAGVFRSATEARASVDDWKRLGTRVDPCLKKAVTQGLSGRQASVRIVPLAKRVRGVDLFGWDILATATVSGHPVTVEVVFLQLLRGREIVQLTIANTGAGLTAQDAARVSGTLESRLARLPAS